MKSETEKEKNKKGDRAPVSLYTLLYFLLLVCVYFSQGCEQYFQPIKDNSRYIFSIYGYLDASADTQWIRITPPRSQLESLPEKPDSITVTLEELESSKTVLMNDSLMQLNGVYIVNYWTTMDIKPEHTYRLTAENAEGMTSRTTVSIPADFPTPELQYRFKRCNGFLYIDGVDKLADVQSRWHYRINIDGDLRHRVSRYGYRDDAYRMDSGKLEVLFREYEPAPLPAGELVDVRREFFVASGGPGWNEKIGTLNDIEYALPDGISNIDNGVGYLAGILSKTVPSRRKYVFNEELEYVTCYDPTVPQQQKEGSLDQSQVNPDKLRVHPGHVQKH